MSLTAERLREVATYSQETGEFHWRIPRRKVRVGAKAGTLSKRGYIDICIDCRVYKAHRLAWLYVYGEWPKDLIDHINGDKTDNRLANLREATKAQNGAHRVKMEARNTSGYRGVRWREANGKWEARAKRHGRSVHIGYFDTAEEAAQAFDKAARVIFGEYYAPLQEPFANQEAA